ncbi:MAG: hypothetical protein MZW92_74685 [Comamonadaceae bacterium]|nr:hypothetical protein [Comamonadaceae bacterium]
MRRRFLNTAALVRPRGGGRRLRRQERRRGTAAAPASAAAGGHGRGRRQPHLKPGELDTYYGLWSGGHTGDMRVLGPAVGPRDPPRARCFNPDALVGWGITNESKKVMRHPSPTARLRYTVADTHHTHASYKRRQLRRQVLLDQRQDPRPHRAHPRATTSNATRSPSCPNIQGFHGIFPDKRDPVDPEHQPHHPRVLRRRVPYPAAERRP